MEKNQKIENRGAGAHLTPVDIYVPNLENYSVALDHDCKPFSLVMNCADLGNNAKFYIVQILYQENKEEYYFWTRWGRVGMIGQNALMGPLDKNKALESYKNKIKDKVEKFNYKIVETNQDNI